MQHLKLKLALAAMSMPQLWAQPSGPKPDFSGRWRAESDAGRSVVLEQTAETITLRESAGKDSRTDLQCSIGGKECEGQVDGEKAKVVFYYNGPALVQMITQDKKVTKVRRTMSSDGNSITVESTPLVPPGKTETAVLVRAEAANTVSAGEH